MSPWIRDPLWDGFWILSGIPFGAALTLAIHAGVPASALILWLVLLTQTGHLLSPMALAWTHDRFRAVMLRRRIKFIVVPLAILAAATVAGWIGGQTLPNLRFNPNSFSLVAGPATLAEFKNPFMAMVFVYVLWNAYHFGMQNFGVMSIYRRRFGFVATQPRARFTVPRKPIGSNPDPSTMRATAEQHRLQRRIDLVYCCAVCWLAMVMPFIPQLGHGLYAATGWAFLKYPLSFRDWPAMHPWWIDGVRPTYFAIAALTVCTMMCLEVHRGACLPRVILILTNALGLVLVWFAGLWGLAIIALNHWLVAIGLAAHVHANERRAASVLPFALTLIILGLVVFAALFIRHCALSTAMLGFTVTGVGFRLGLGFVHFLYDRWIYQLSNPQVRATIGRNIFSSTA